MEYSAELPATSGWYWLKKRGKEPEVVKVEVFQSFTGREWMRVGGEVVRKRYEYKKNNWLWAGPVSEPEVGNGQDGEKNG